MSETLSLLLPAPAPGWQAVQAHLDAQAQAGAWTDARDHDALLLQADDAAALGALAAQPALPSAALECAVLVLTPVHDEALETALLHLGVEALVAPGDAAAMARALRHAVLRKRLEIAARTAYATDLATGLPHRAQLIEHMAQLLALREREPAPMALVVLRVAGLDRVAQRQGADAATVLRRKLAVRLRSALRASDVVASISPDSFGVLLGRLDSNADGQRVASKLTRAVAQPLSVSGRATRLVARVGLALYPQHGRNAPALLQHAVAQAGGRDTEGAATLAGTLATTPAANDEA